jgi:hypothetical protein
MTGDRHVMPDWQEHDASAGCWCQPKPSEPITGMDGVGRRVWLHRAAHDDPHKYDEAADPAVRLGHGWVVSTSHPALTDADALEGGAG